jgi:hypothetical protein
MGVNPGRFTARMAEHSLFIPEVNPVFEAVCGKGMTHGAWCYLLGNAHTGGWILYNILHTFF